MISKMLWWPKEKQVKIITVLIKPTTRGSEQCDWNEKMVLKEK